MSQLPCEMILPASINWVHETLAVSTTICYTHLLTSEMLRWHVFYCTYCTFVMFEDYISKNTYYQLLKISNVNEKKTKA